jgi:hypothetical protein
VRHPLAMRMAARQQRRPGGKGKQALRLQQATAAQDSVRPALGEVLHAAKAGASRIPPCESLYVWSVKCMACGPDFLSAHCTHLPVWHLPPLYPACV